MNARPLPAGGAVLVMHDVTETAPAGSDAAGLRRQRVARAEDPAYLDLGLRRDPPDRYARPRDSSAAFSTTIVTNARRMQRLVDNLLDLARHRGRPLAARARSRWTWPRPPGRPGQACGTDPGRWRWISRWRSRPTPATVLADADALRQVLTNLLDNSLRYTPRGRAHRVPEPADRGTALRVSVADTGTGNRARAPAPHLRALLPRRPVPLSGGGRYRPGTRHRQAPG